jgi:signal peptidase I
VSIDRKDPYVKRCVAVAGDVLEMKAGKLFINGKPEQRMGDAEVQQAYEVTTNSQLDIKNLYKAYGFLSVTEDQKDHGFQYDFSGLTDGLAKEIKQLNDVVSVEPKIDSLGQHEISYYPNIPQSIENQRLVLSNKINYSATIFPHNKPWNIDWYGPLKIPKKGDIITLTADNLPTYQKLIKEYEHNDLEIKGGKFFINGKETNTYTVQQDYYFMMGDNRDSSLDARYFGFVPETHIVGKPLFTWMSVEGLFSDQNSTYQADGKKIRWDRMFKATNTGDPNKTSYWWVAAIVLTLFFGWDFFAKFFKKKKG